MKCYYLIIPFFIFTTSKLHSQCTITADNDDYTVEIDITAVELLTTQNGTTCNAQVVLEYDITISDGGPSWWTGDLFTLQGRLVCDDAAGSSFFDLPNGGGSGAVTTANFSYNNFDCEDVVLDCVVEIEANGPGLNFDDACGSVALASLPVSFTKVYHQESDGTYTIHWETAAELNSDYYQVIRSQDGRNWQAVAKIPSDNSTTGSQYEAAVPHEATSYYRVKNIDFDGKEQLSETILVTAKRDHQPSILPSLVSEQFTVFTNTVAPYRLTVLDVAGRVVLDQQVADRAIVDVSALPAGTYGYILTSSTLGTNTNGRFVKL